jgi:hypothetical protein
LKSFRDVFLALRHRRNEETGRTFLCDGGSNRCDIVQRAVHTVRAACAVDMFVDEPRQNDSVFRQNDFFALYELADFFNFSGPRAYFRSSLTAEESEKSYIFVGIRILLQFVHNCVVK